LSGGQQCITQAETTLLRALNLENWQAPEPLSYVRNSREAFTAGRLDAEFFAPRIRMLLKQLRRDKRCIADFAPVRHEAFKSHGKGTFHYIEIGSLKFPGIADAEELLQSDAPSRASQKVRAGDVITSSVRPIRRLSALITDAQDGYVCSSGFVVLKPQKVSSELLLTYLRLPAICELMDLYASASMYPAISERDLLALPMPYFSEYVEKQITKIVQDGWILRIKSARFWNPPNALWKSPLSKTKPPR
jgi:hypothetical protein